MHIVGINFISFTAHNNALHMLGKRATFGILGGMAPLPHNTAYELGYPPLSLFSLLLPFLFSPSSYISPFLFSLPFSFLSFSFLYFLSFRLEVRPLESICGAFAPSVGSGAEPQWKSNLVDFNL